MHGRLVLCTSQSFLPSSLGSFSARGSADQAPLPAQMMQGFLSQLRAKERARVEAVLTSQPVS